MVKPATSSFSRRTFLRGVGVSMALPWLESLPVFGQNGSQVQAAQPPVRFACLFSGNGFHSREWWARGEGARMELGRVLGSLRPFREKMLFLRGLYNQEALIGGIHSCQTGNLLTGAHLAPGGEIRSGISCDQVIANRMRDHTKVPSLVLGCEPSIAAIHKNYSMIYSSHISWSSATTPTPLEVFPARAFDRLFRDDVRRADRSVLDSVMEDTRGLRNQVSQADQRRWTNICRVSEMWNNRSNGPAGPVVCKVGDPRSPGRTCPARPTACRKTSISTCGSCATSWCWPSRPIPPAYLP